MQGRRGGTERRCQRNQDRAEHQEWQDECKADYDGQVGHLCIIQRVRDDFALLLEGRPRLIARTDLYPPEILALVYMLTKKFCYSIMPVSREVSPRPDQLPLDRLQQPCLQNG